MKARYAAARFGVPNLRKERQLENDSPGSAF
jgi:hypothetical protein